MNIDAKVIQRLGELLTMGEQLLATQRDPGPNVIGDDRVNSQLAYQWATSVQNLLVRVFGPDSEHYKNFTKQIERGITYSPAFRAQGILKAARDDYESGYSFEIQRLVEAELFDDFLEAAEYLFNSGYYQPGAVIAGCVLEDGLRKLCQRDGVVLPENPKLDTMNAELTKTGTFTKLVQKKITALADLRNKAAHGQWSEFSKEDVREMISAVRRIMEEYFS